MITAVAHKNLAHARGYFTEHLTQNDYYAAGEVRPGLWMGTAANRLGLADVVKQTEFLALCENRDPAGDRRLTARCLIPGERRVYYDFTCSAPKSVSVMAVTLADDRLITAHEESARVAFRELEAFASTRVRRGLRSVDRTTGNLVAAEFLHTSSRALDPQLHTHYTVFNATWDADEARWKALQAGPMYQAVRYATQVYRNELARRLDRIGYSLVRSGAGFEIAGVPPSVLRQFSKRSIDRDRVVSEMEKRLGRSLTRDEVSHAVHQSRPRKIPGITTSELQARQWDQLGAVDREHLIRLRDHARPASAVLVHAEDEALQHALAHVFERRSVVPRHELLEVSLGHRPGQVDLEVLKQRMAQHRGLIHTERGISSRMVLRQELDLIDAVRDGRGACLPMVPRFSSPTGFSVEQSSALQQILGTCDRITAIRGKAGTGKTTLLREIHRAARNAGVHVQFCAPTSAATAVLSAEGLPAVTVERLKTLPSRSRMLTVVDEAGAVGVADLHAIMQREGRILLCGDTGQHGPVARGDALRILERHSPLQVVELSEIRRQRPALYRQAVYHAAQRDIPGALDRLDRMGAVRELPVAQVHAEAAQAYCTSIRSGRSLLIVAPTWAEIDRITDRIRDRLKSERILASEERTIPALRSTAWTQAQRGDPGSYRIGQCLRFHQAQSGFKRREQVEVVDVGAVLTVRRADGSTSSLDVRCAARSFEVGERLDLKVCIGEKLLLQANAPGFIRGELVEVAGFEGDGIRLSDGRALPPDYRSFAHGYAVTSHSAQGRTVDGVILVATAVSMPAVNQEQFYVSVSRGRDHCRILTDDRNLLRAHLSRSGHRLSAVEACTPSSRTRRILARGVEWLRRVAQYLGRTGIQVDAIAPLSPASISLSRANQPRETRSRMTP